jgi:hypothetical protein
MSLLNSKHDQFLITFPKGFFYPEVLEKWNPIIKRLKLNYETLEDFINACIQGVTFPNIDLNTQTQQQGQFQIHYRGGKEMEPIFDKQITVTFKLSEAFLSYWILFDQVTLYREYSDRIPFWPPLYLSFLDHHGFELITFELEYIVPTNVSNFTVSYTTTLSDFASFNLDMRYNRFNIKNRFLKNE